MKTCSKCKQVTSLENFHKEARKKDGLCSHCKDCESIRTRARADKDRAGFRKKKRENARKHSEKTKAKWKQKYPIIKEEYLAKRREDYQENREKIRFRQNELHKKPEYKEKANERQKKWCKENREARRKIAKKWLDSNKDAVTAWHTEWRRNNREKARASQQIRDHIRRGTMTRPENCEICLKKCKPEGHHKDYSKPLDVQWLCRTCHLHQHDKLLDVKP